MTFTSFIEEEMQGQLLKYAAGRQIFCPNCDGLLDWRTTAIVAISDGERTDSRIYCTTCVGDEARAKFHEMVKWPQYPVVKVEVDTITGTEVWDADEVANFFGALAWNKNAPLGEHAASVSARVTSHSSASSPIVLPRVVGTLALRSPARFSSAKTAWTPPARCMSSTKTSSPK